MRKKNLGKVLWNRLRKKDINKRKQNKIILTKIYTPSFTPFIYTKKENIKKTGTKNDRRKKNKSQ